MNLEQAMQSFLLESAELLQEMESILLEAEADSITAEQLGALFRCMHTIKGSAGLFGLDDIVHFSHQAENLLDQLRDGKLQLDAELSGLLLRSHDHVKAQLAALEAGQPLPAGEAAAIEAEMAQRLQAEPPPSASTDETHPPLPSSDWLLTLRFGPDVLRNGMDPASFIRYLATLGEIKTIASRSSSLPADEHFDPERNYLRLELQFYGAVDAEQLDGVFAFASEGSQFIISPRTQLEQHLAQALSLGDAAEQQCSRQLWQQWGLLPEPQPAGETAATTPDEPPCTAEPLVPTAMANPPADSEGKTTRSSESRFIKVEAGKLDSLINLVGELVIAGAATSLLARRHGNGPLLESTAVLSGLIEQIRDQSLAMRMVPIGETFSRFGRVVHDVSRALGKEIRLQVSGADTELDKSMVDKLADPLTHLVRNAIDHGIEDVAQRRAAGKPDAGHLWLDAYHDSGSVVIEVADDGGGLSRQRILDKARQRGMLHGDSPLAEQDVFRLIFEAGFSTAAQVSNLSGRGVGLDVVKQNIEQLRGTVEVESEEGLGTTFRLRLPLTLAIIDGFLVTVGSATFVLPLDSVVECMALPEAALATAAMGRFSLRGEVLPLLNLRRFLELDGQPGHRQNVVVIQTGDCKVGLVVDALNGEFQTVIKPLSPLFRQLKAISGSTILGNGEVALILDVLALTQHARAQEHMLYLDGQEAASLLPDHWQHHNDGQTGKTS
ncbi:signal transduction histidine kinase CheA [Aquitalea magnusonii]|uniref:Chemotaxis protein CheA n=1 Tax=Aquitalea magnusonii TaxID=332411 RepID=A0A3G9GAM8_9NEIS|nr:chemotaxis protein CheA [Aquitalea magnusonii]BBF83893.1 signal transduction histidine kinase CheA [Aquitalea magnusonii]